ncbi:hypothetical protein FB451DRAFT_1408339 [Mycena latifolia]|nr:hypothetical protein FB451DRAFT_1408339 [Mycena latifolia]
MAGIINHAGAGRTLPRGGHGHECVRLLRGNFKYTQNGEALATSFFLFRSVLLSLSYFLLHICRL